MATPSPTYIEEFRTIAESFAAGELGFLIGAGMSMGKSGIPDGREMAIRMLRRAIIGKEDDASYPDLDELASKYPFEAVAELLTKKQSHRNFAEWLLDNGGLGKAQPMDVHEHLHELYLQHPHRFPKAIFTTNFDTLIEDRFDAREAICITSENIEDVVKARKENKVAIIHLHGCVKYPKSIIVGELPLATSEGPIFDLLRGALAVDTFVLVGYSLSDTNLRRIFFDVQRVAVTRQGLNKRTFAVGPADGDPKDDTTESGLTRIIWRQRDVDHIAVTAEAFFLTLFESVDDFVIVRMRKVVAERLGKDETTLNKMLDSAAEPFDIFKPNDILIYLYYALTPIGTKL